MIVWCRNCQEKEMAYKTTIGASEIYECDSCGASVGVETDKEEGK